MATPQFAPTEVLLRNPKGLPGVDLALMAGSSIQTNYEKAKLAFIHSTPTCGGASPVCPDGSSLSTEGRKPCTGGR